MPAPQLDRTIDFTKFTLGLAAAGFAYVAETAVKRSDWFVKGLGLIALVSFAFAVIFGALVLGRAAKIENLEGETTLFKVGRLHSFFLILGLSFAAIVVFVRIAVQGE
jgi:hypothetical protein